MVEFVSYDGKWPNLCSGNLRLRIDGMTVLLENCMVSGGCCSFDEEYNDYIGTGPWRVEVPDHFQDKLDEIEECVNQHVRWGCCGGCI